MVIATARRTWVSCPPPRIFFVVVLLLLVGCVSSSLTSPPPQSDKDNQASFSTLPGISAVSQGVQTLGNVFAGLVPRKEPRLPKQVEVALVGFGRTGTTSMVAALEILGYTMQHDDSLFEVADLHGRLANPKDAFDIDDFVTHVGRRGFDGIFFYSDEFLQWAARSENTVKVLLTKRDNARKWAKSWLTIAPNVDSIESRPFVWFQPFRDLTPGYFQLIYKHISTMGQPEKYKDLATLEAAYEAHLIKVRRMIPPDRLLEFNVKEGWEPLCQFLDKPIPPAQVDFPHVNDRMVAQVIVWTLIAITWIWPLFPILIVYLAWRLVGMVLSTKKTTGPSNKKLN